MQDDDKFKTAKDTSSKASTALGLAFGVTGANYVEKAKTFMVLRGGKGAMICQRSGLTRGDMKPIEADLRKWGAWMAYFVRIGRPRPTRKFIESRDYQMVPAEWPHEFDGAATVLDDENAASEFVRRRAAYEAKAFDRKHQLGV